MADKNLWYLSWKLQKIQGMWDVSGTSKFHLGFEKLNETKVFIFSAGVCYEIFEAWSSKVGNYQIFIKLQSPE